MEVLSLQEITPNYASVVITLMYEYGLAVRKYNYLGSVKYTVSLMMPDGDDLDPLVCKQVWSQAFTARLPFSVR